jgi:hypothetical protein
LSKEQQDKAKSQYRDDHFKGKSRSTSEDDPLGDNSSEGDESESSSIESPSHFGFVKRFFSPLALFLPVVIHETTSSGIHQRKDWSLTFLGMSMFLVMLSTGVFQIKYLYAVHTYNWAADQLSYYISYLGGLRALGLLFLFPTIISTFKPKPPASETGQGKQAKPTKNRLAVEINFDLLLTRCSIFIDILSQFLVTVFPSPSVVHHMRETTGSGRGATWLHDPTTRSTVLFVFASGFSSIGSGFIPACQSLALCIVQARQLLLESSAQVDGNTGAGAGMEHSKAPGIGKLFGALSMLQAVGQMILGPLFFGLLYGNTVAYFPKAIFVAGGGILTAALVCAFMIRSPVERHLRVKGKASGKKRTEREEPERGRSRAHKDLFGVIASEQLQRSNSAGFAADP